MGHGSCLLLPLYVLHNRASETKCSPWKHWVGAYSEVNQSIATFRFGFQTAHVFFFQKQKKIFFVQKKMFFFLTKVLFLQKFFSG